MQKLNTLRRKYQLTQNGLKNLQTKLQGLKVERQKLIGRLKSLRSQQSTRMFIEDSMAIQTLSNLQSTESKIEQLEDTLYHAEIIAPSKQHRKVQVGSSVKLRDNNSEITYTIVTSLEADPFSGKISDESPLGRLLIGRRLRDFITLPNAVRQKVRRVQLVGID